MAGGCVRRVPSEASFGAVSLIHQAAINDEEAQPIDRGQSVLGRKREAVRPRMRSHRSMAPHRMGLAGGNVNAKHHEHENQN